MREEEYQYVPTHLQSKHSFWGILLNSKSDLFKWWDKLLSKSLELLKSKDHHSLVFGCSWQRSLKCLLLLLLLQFKEHECSSRHHQSQHYRVYKHIHWTSKFSSPWFKLYDTWLKFYVKKVVCWKEQCLQFKCVNKQYLHLFLDLLPTFIYLQIEAPSLIALNVDRHNLHLGIRMDHF